MASSSVARPDDNINGDIPSLDPAKTQHTDTAPDPFDVARLRLAATDVDAFGVREALLQVPFTKPSKECFFRVNHHPEYQLAMCGVIELKDVDSAFYWVDPSLWPALAAEPTFHYRALFTAVTVQGQVFLWGCRLPGQDGKIPAWVSIPLEAARQAQTQWTKMVWDQTTRRHRVFAATGITAEPVWPNQPLEELIRLAFKDAVIKSLDHVILKKLRGEM